MTRESSRPAPSLRPAKGMILNRSARLRKGRYAIPVDPEDAAIVIEGRDLNIDLTDVELLGGEGKPWERRGIGILIRNSQNVRLRGGRIAGYRLGLAVHRSQEVHVSDCNVSANFDQKLSSTDAKYDSSDWLDIFHPRLWRKYGFGVYAYRCKQCSFAQVKSSRHQNGIGLDNCRRITIQNCDVSRNSGWGVWLWASSDNVVVGNKADHCVRCESKAYSAGGDSAGIILSHRCCRNVIAQNSFTHSGDGFFLNGLNVEESTDNLIAFNDGSHSPHNAFESSFSRGNVFIGNIASNSRYGMWLGLSYENRILGNIIENNLFDGIAIEHAHDNVILGNMIRRNRAGIALLYRNPRERRSSAYTVSGNIIQANKVGISLDAADHIRIEGNDISRNAVSLLCSKKCSDLRVRSNNVLGGGDVRLADTSLADLNDNYWGSLTLHEVRRRISIKNDHSLRLTTKRGTRIPLPRRPVLVDYTSTSRQSDHSFVWYQGLKRLIGL